ncbi:MAG: alpha/beta fold hydrolase [Rickettsiales bacterium]|jgi:pimeloyl-ACP methyl ester carboxylesterase|nr:alpha/beta fold hydrolase [Rickettsiales bacterium]
MEALFVKHLNLQLCVHSFGIKTNPAVVLISGSAGQAILWDKTFCENIAKAGYFVIRFDNRDTGLSSGINFQENPYNLKDLAGDVIGILDHFKIEKAHIVGMSMGGYIAQKLAIYYPNKILSMTLFMTTINSSVMRGIRGMDNLPGQSLDIVKKLSEIYQTPRITLNDRIKVLIETWKLFNGTESPFPYDEWRELAEESYKRAKTKNAVRNHRAAVLNSPSDRGKILKEIDLPPTLILHGKADPIIQIAHAYYGHKLLPQSELVIIDKMGHLLTSVFTAQVEDALLKFFESIET